MTEQDDDENIALEAHPKWSEHVKHYQEMEKAQWRIGTTPFKTMQWLVRLLSRTEEELADLGTGAFNDLAYEIAVFSLLGTQRLKRIKPGHTIFMSHTWEGAQWSSEKGIGESIPTRNETHEIRIELQRIVDNLLSPSHRHIHSFPETKLVIEWSNEHGYLFTFHARIQDRFKFHAMHLMAKFAPRLRRCARQDCPRTFVWGRRIQLYCSRRCETRITTRRARDRARSTKMEPSPELSKLSTKPSHELNHRQKKGVKNGKTRRKR